jgi:Sec-independent protein translocase protein TatA
MNIFGIGPLEIVFVLIIGILVLGPEGMVETGRKLGRFMRSIIHSSWWKNIRQGVTEIQHLPQRLIREAELEELNQLGDLTKKGFPKIGGNDLMGSSWSGAASSDKEPGPEAESPTKTKASSEDRGE